MGTVIPVATGPARSLFRQNHRVPGNHPLAALSIGDFEPCPYSDSPFPAYAGGECVAGRSARPPEARRPAEPLLPS
jgi:hypothetical protein